MAKIISKIDIKFEKDLSLLCRHTRVNIEFGQAKYVSFSPDGK